MGKLGITFGVLFFVLLSSVIGSSLLWAGGADNKTNWSAEYIGILNRNAATDAADIAMYNPAGVMKMNDGFYGNLSVHYLPKDYNNEIDGTDFDQDDPSVIPGLFAVYKQDKWAGFFAVSNVVGGGKVDFKQGNATTNFVKSGVRASPGGAIFDLVNQEYLKAEATGMAYTIGGAYELNDIWSVALGVRYVKSDREMEGIISLGSSIVPAATYIADVKFEEKADGFGGVIGVNFSPSDRLNFGLHYDTKVTLDYKAYVERDTTVILPDLGVVDGEKRSRNLPAVLAAGLSYKVTPDIRIETNATFYLNKDANFKDIAGTSRDESAVDTGYDVGIGVDYALTDSLNATLGYLYTKTGVDAKDMTPELPELNANTLGAGLKYKATDRLNLMFSLGHVFYQDASFVNGFSQAITYEKKITFFGVGLEYKFF
jgi:long-chain fatty acid transport protein